MNNLNEIYWLASSSEDGKTIVCPNNKSNWQFAILRIGDFETTYYWSSHILINNNENHMIRAYQGSSNLYRIRVDAKDGKLSMISEFPETNRNRLIEARFFYIN